MAHPSPDFVPVRKDETAQHPVATVWRPVLEDIVRAFVQGDYELSLRPSSVMPVRTHVGQQIREYISDDGRTLVELPDEAWSTSVCQWMETHWEVLVDLWTLESGESDLVLSVRVFESDDGFVTEVGPVYVP
jgi:hypothetical protein